MTATVKLGEYVYRCEPRWGYGRPVHPALAQVISAAAGEMARRLESFAAHADRLAAIPLRADEHSPDPRWANPWFTGVDAVALYGMLAETNPRLLIEVGSGNSTKFARRAIGDLGLRTSLISIDPQPRAEVDSLCDEVIRAPAEKVDPHVFARLKSGDILFIDSSHRTFENSDVTALFLEILPALPPGVMVHIHDIYLPHDYPPQSEGLLYNEQYLLAAYLLANPKWLAPVMACYQVTQDPALVRRLAPVWQAMGTNTFPAPSTSFWLRTGKRR